MDINQTIDQYTLKRRQSLRMAIASGGWNEDGTLTLDCPMHVSAQFEPMKSVLCECIFDPVRLEFKSECGAKGSVTTLSDQLTKVFDADIKRDARLIEGSMPAKKLAEMLGKMQSKFQ
jgi:hypothetical protein